MDVTAEDFDPEAALNQPDASAVSVPYPNIAELANISECSKLVPPSSVKEDVEEMFGPRRPVNSHLT
jgi:hypothetical protein